MLKFRELFMDRPDGFDVDPFRYTTLASLCMAMYRCSHMPANSIPCHTAAKQDSCTAREWLGYMQDTTDAVTYPEHRVRLKLEEGELVHLKVPKCGATAYIVDGYVEKTNTILQFHGCYWHGCPTCNKDFDKRHAQTVEMTDLFKFRGFNVVEKWECQWTANKKTMEQDVVT